MSYKHIEVTPISGMIGAEIHGVDITQAAIAPDVIDEIRHAFLENLVVFFRDQDLDDDALVGFGRKFGELAALPPHRQVPGSYPEILVVEKQPEDNMVFGWEWHSDTSHLETPSLGSILCAKIVPECGGDTLFANQYAAYDALSDGMKRMLGDLTAIHANGRILRTLSEKEMPPPGTESESAVWSEMWMEHPVVRTHPETRRKALYVNEMHTERFKDMSVEESQPLLQFLYAHAARPEFTCRFHWEAGSVAFWDNRCATHLALNDYAGHHRLMRRVQVKGDRPV
ncbi:MAG: TauD/TfdA family dioxygenase [Alphaproteobacteria bacterium]|nr:TauD/TfdA family dioxygenase [Alphaproteobacteria bacterium]